MNPEDCKTCSRCQTVKHLGEFPKAKGYLGGRNCWCHACHSDYMRERSGKPGRKPGESKTTVRMLEASYNPDLVQGIMARHGLELSAFYQRMAWNSAARNVEVFFHEALEQALVDVADRLSETITAGK